MRRQRLLIALVVALSFLVTLTMSAGAGQKKAVHVKEYKRKDGTTVKAHDRQPPKENATKVAKAKKESSAKTSAVTTARDERGRIQRSAAARHAFARQTGYPNGRPGYVIDHIIPLACGGADDPSNMQWQTVEAAKAKDRVERAGC